MVKLIVKVPKRMALKLERESKLERVPKSKIVCDALGKELKSRRISKIKEVGPTLYDLMKDGFGCVDSGVTDRATNPKYMKGFGKWRR